MTINDRDQVKDVTQLHFFETTRPVRGEENFDAYLALDFIAQVAQVPEVVDQCPNPVPHPFTVMSGLTALKIDKRKPLASRHLLIWRAYQFFGHATLLPNPVFWEARGSEFSDKPLISLVGAAGFEPQPTS